MDEKLFAELMEAANQMEAHAAGKKVKDYCTMLVFFKNVEVFCS